MFIRIIATPPGEAPEEVRQAWVGLELPLAAGETGPRRISVGGVLTGPRTFFGKLFKLLTGRRQYARGYLIAAPQALLLLAEKSPWAAQWWRECAPHCWQPGQVFVFHAEVCAEVSTRELGQQSPTQTRTSSEEFFSSGPTDVTQGLTPKSSNVTKEQL